MFKMPVVSAALLLAALAAPAMAQTTANPDFRIRAKFRVPDDATFAAGSSIGNADFRIRARFAQLYYGGVQRADDFKFSTSLDFTDQSGFPSSYLSSVFNTPMDMYVDNAFVGRLNMNAETVGMGDLTYDSRHAELPDLPIPANFPMPMSVGQTVRLFTAASTTPAIGAPLPVGTPLLVSTFEEPFARGDVNQDNRVDTADFAFLVSNYDPYHRMGLHVGPVAADFTGDNMSDLADYQMMAQNWTASTPIPAVPAPIAPPCTSDINVSGSVTTQDVFDFMSLWFSGDSRADINHVNSVTVQDIFDFLTAWFSGC